MIQHLSLKHGWFYHYRVHKDKVAELCAEFPTLAGFLQNMLVKGACPDAPFNEGPRSSSLRFPVDVDIKKVAHPITQMAAAALVEGRYSTAHSNVQVFLLQHDKSTIAVEVPLWWMTEEMGSHSTIIPGADTGPLSGHIDVLSVEDGNIWVWDYKPGARKEKYASTQTYYYALMLAERTGVPLDRIRCGWFDEKDAYVFQPSLRL